MYACDSKAQTHKHEVTQYSITPSIMIFICNMFLNQVYLVLFSVRKCHATFTIVEYLSETLLIARLGDLYFFSICFEGLVYFRNSRLLIFITDFHKIGGYQVMIKCLSSEHRYTCLVKKALKLQIARLTKVAYM